MRLEGRQFFEEVTEHRLADLFFGKAGSKMTASCCCKRILEKSKEFPTDDPDSFMNYETMMARLLSFHEPDLVPLYPKFVRNMLERRAQLSKKRSLLIRGGLFCYFYHYQPCYHSHSVFVYSGRGCPLLGPLN